MELTIKSEFHNIIPPISPEEYALLEESILKEGCREPIVVWKGFILDGHNRYEICKKHDIKVDQSTDMSFVFKSEDECIVWIIRNQLARRNLLPHERIRLALLLKPAIEEKAKEQQGTRSDIPQKSAKGFKPIDTREEVAKLAGVSHDTVRKSEIIEKEATPEVKEAVRKGEVSVNKAYQTTRQTAPQKEPKEESDALFQLKRWWKKSNQKDRKLFLKWI